MREREGETLHDLCVVSTSRGDLDAAERLASEAFEIYRDGHPRLPALVYDCAVIWMERGQFSKALHVLRVLPPFMEEPHERAWAAAMLARAAAACGDEQMFDQALAQAWELLEESASRSAVPACVELGVGASSLHRWDQAEQALRHARKIASNTGEAEPRADVALDAVAAGRVAERDRDPDDAQNPPTDDGMAASFVAALRNLRVEG